MTGRPVTAAGFEHAANDMKKSSGRTGRGQHGSPPSFSAYERRLAMEIDRILYQNYFTPRTVLDFWGGDRAAVVTHLKMMKERVVRAMVVSEYVEVDDMLNRTIVKHVLGRKSHVKNRRVLDDLLDRLYPQQKLDVIASFREVPSSVAHGVSALNTLRNTFAHRFQLERVPKSKRLYKGKHDLFTKKGLEQFKGDMWDIQMFFQPVAAQAALDLVQAQKARNRRRRK